MKILFAILLVLLFSTATQAQKNILDFTLEVYGKNLTFVTTRSDDEYIILQAKGGTDDAIRNVFFLIHPDRGIISSETVKSAVSETYDLIATTGRSITIFYKTGFSHYYSLTFDKDTGKADLSEIDDSIKRTNQESAFSFMKDGSLLFVSTTKDKQKIAFRELTKNGNDNVRYVFDLPEPLRKYVEAGARDGFGKEFTRTAYAYGTGVRFIGTNVAKQMAIVDVFEFDMLSHTVSHETYSEYNKFNSFSAAIQGNLMFVIKSLNKPIGYERATEFYFDILEYPSMKKIQSKIYNEDANQIDIKSSHFYQVKYKVGIYHSGNNKKYTDFDTEGASTQKMIQALSIGILSIRIRSIDGNIHMLISSDNNQFLTNTSYITESYFSGCLNARLEPCNEDQASRSPFTSAFDFLMSTSDERPEYKIAGHARDFYVFWFKRLGRIVITEY